MSPCRCPLDAPLPLRPPAPSAAPPMPAAGGGPASGAGVTRALGTAAPRAARRPLPPCRGGSFTACPFPEACRATPSTRKRTASPRTRPPAARGGTTCLSISLFRRRTGPPPSRTIRWLSLRGRRRPPRASCSPQRGARSLPRCAQEGGEGRAGFCLPLSPVLSYRPSGSLSAFPFPPSPAAVPDGVAPPASARCPYAAVCAPPRRCGAAGPGPL